jgi:hypothetical protein
LHEGAIPSLRSVLRFSLPLDGLLRLRLAGLSSRCHVQGSPVQGCGPQPYRLVAR